MTTVLDTARSALERYHDVTVDDDGTLIIFEEQIKDNLG